MKFNTSINMDADDLIKALGLDPEFLADLRQSLGDEKLDQLMILSVSCIRAALVEGGSCVACVDDDHGFLIGVSLDGRTHEEKLAIYKLVNLLLDKQNIRLEAAAEVKTSGQILAERFTQATVLLAFIGLVKLVFFL